MIMSINLILLIALLIIINVFTILAIALMICDIRNVLRSIHEEQSQQ